MIRLAKRVARKILRRREVLTFQVKVTDHCNLDCVGCNVFSPISEKSYLDVDAHTRDMTRIRKVFGDRCDVIFSGGEPMLHPKIVDLLAVSRRLFKKSRITLLTNGLLMLRQKEAFWDALRENRIRVQVTKYPVKCDYDGIVRRCREMGIEFEYHDGDTPKDVFITQAINPRGDGDASANYHRCSIRHCTMLSEGKLYACVITANIKHFNLHFGYELPVFDGDYVDIYQERRASRMMRQLYNRSTPLPFCRYCDIDTKLSSGVAYKRSAKRLSEWVNSDKLTKE